MHDGEITRWLSFYVSVVIFWLTMQTRAAFWGFPSFLTFESGEAGVDVGCEAEDGGGVDEGFTHVGHDGVGEFSNGRYDEGRDVECYA